MVGDDVKMIELTPQQQALLSYMEYESEERWCAGWLIDLHKALAGDPAYEWLVSEAGGHWEFEPGHPIVRGRPLKWVPNE